MTARVPMSSLSATTAFLGLRSRFNRLGSLSTTNLSLMSGLKSSCCAWRRGIEIDVGEEKEFVYSRASPSVRWPDSYEESQQQGLSETLSGKDLRAGDAEETVGEEDREGHTSPIYRLMEEDKVRTKASNRELFHQRQKGQVRRIKRMNKLALKKAVDWKDRTQRLTDAICELELARPVADVLESWPEQLNNEDLSVVLRNVGDENWRRSLELYEWVNLRKWYTPNPRMLTTILRVLGKANRVEHARELFWRAEPELTADHIQVFHGILGVYAKQGNWQAVQHILELMEQRGCEPDIITFNTIVNARCKGDLQPGMAFALLEEVQRAGLKPDIITFNTLLGGCIANKNFTEAREIVKVMVQRGFRPDAYTIHLLGKKNLNLDKVAELT